VTQISRALNGYSDVNAATRSRVVAAALEHNYTPNTSARKLVSGRSGIVGLIQKEYLGLSSDSGFMESVIGLSTEFSRRKMQFVLHIASDEEDELDSYRHLSNSSVVDGYMLINPVINDRRISFLQNNSTPFAVHGHAEKEPNYAYFDIDNFAVGYQLASHLLNRGHHNIAAIMGLKTTSHVIHRLNGIQQAFKERSIPFPKNLTRYGLMTENFGLVSAAQLFSSPKKPSALIADNLLIAKGAFKSIEALGYKIPNDVSVVAHDDVRPTIKAEMFSSPLTTTQSPLNKSWGPLVEILQGSIEKRPIKSLQKTVKIELIERDSVKAISIPTDSK
ncbi:MAG: LacI family transcriptional regulator, partial [Gammaproteobacteria bacterium]|nr:LacI family transcriptional regulator [Gammaproteobacteria bacterium]